MGAYREGVYPSFGVLSNLIYRISIPPTMGRRRRDRWHLQAPQICLQKAKIAPRPKPIRRECISRSSERFGMVRRDADRIMKNTGVPRDAPYSACPSVAFRG